MPIKVNLPDGRVVNFPDGMDPAQIQAEVQKLAPATDTSDQGPQEPSVVSQRGIVDKAVDWLPSVGGTVGGYLSRAKGTPFGAVVSGLGAATGEVVRQGIRLAQGRGDEVPDTFTDAMKRAGTIGMTNAAQEAGGRKLIAGLSRIAPKFMRGALGAQTEVRKSFPDVDLDKVAVRERVVVPRDAGRVAQLAESNAAWLRQNLKAQGPQHVVSYDDAISELKRMVPDARSAARGGRPERAQALSEATGELRRVRDSGGVHVTRTPIPQAVSTGTGWGPQPTSVTPQLVRTVRQPGGLSAEDAYVASRDWASKGKGALQAKPGARGTADAEAANAVRLGMSTGLKRRVPQYADDVARQQELMALERAMFNAAPRTSILRDTIGAATGVGAGMTAGDPVTGALIGAGTMAVNRAVTSPAALSRYALGSDALARGMGTGYARVPDAMVRQAFLELLGGKYAESPK
jgi:hypothetical protein